MSLANDGAISIHYHPDIEAKHTTALGYSRTHPEKTHSFLHSALTIAPEYYGDDTVSWKLHESRLRRDIALAKTRRLLDIIRPNPAIAKPDYVRQFKGAEDLLAGDLQKLNPVLDLKLTPEAKIEVENQLAASEGHIGRIAMAKSCLLEIYPSTRAIDVTNESIKDIFADAQERLKGARKRMRIGVHNPYFIASLAGNQLRAAVLSENIQPGQRGEVVKIAAWCLRNFFTSSNHRRGLRTCGRLFLQSTTRKMAIASILKGHI